MGNYFLYWFLSMVRRASVIVGVSICLLVVNGCGVFFGDDGMFRNKSKDYLLASEEPPLHVPAELDGDAVGELFRVPEIPETSVLDDEGGTPRPQLLSTNVLEEEVKIQSLSGRKWILINRLPSEVWPRVRTILSRNGVTTTRVDASAGIIETVWLEFDEDSEHNHRYRIAIEQGVQPKSTEIAVLHMAMIKDADIPVWPESSTDVERENTMLNVLASDLAGDGSSGTVSMLAQKIGGESKVDILTPLDETPYILLKLDYDRSWASVGHSVNKDDFSIIDQDRTAGIFYVHYSVDDEDDEPGFIARMLGAGTDEEIPKANCQVQLLPTDGGVKVIVLDQQQDTFERAEALRLLKKIRSNLS